MFLPCYNPFVLRFFISRAPPPPPSTDVYYSRSGGPRISSADGQDISETIIAWISRRQASRGHAVHFEIHKIRCVACGLSGNL